MQELIDSIEKWRPINPPERLERIKSASRNAKRIAVGNRISPIDLYAYLKARFGDPNGIQSLLRGPFSDNLFHWQYAVGTDEFLFEVAEGNLCMDALVEGVGDIDDAEIDRFFLAIKHDFANYGGLMTNVRKELEHWKLFINPYKRLYDVLQRTKQQLINLDIASINVPETPETKEELVELQEVIKVAGPKFDDALDYSLKLKMLSPVLGEAFVNLLIFILAKDDIKNDGRLYQDAIRREIDVRVKSLHLTCDGFSKAVDSDSNEFKDFHTVMNGRNDFLHGNIDPTKLEYDEVYFDYKTVPIFKNRASFGQLALSNKLIHIEPDSALADLDAVLAFINLVLESLDEDVRNLVSQFMATTSPGWNPSARRAGVLFSEEIIHSVIDAPSTSQTTDEPQLADTIGNTDSPTNI